MREESHLDDMRAAIRGDFERLEQRRGVQELMHVQEPEPEQEPEPVVRVEPLPDMAQIEAGEVPEQPSRSWLNRLLAAIPPRQV